MITAPFPWFGGKARTDEAVENSKREVIWFSPHCAAQQQQMEMPL